MRASINVLGPLVARCGAAEVALPGGDAIGVAGSTCTSTGLERMGATVRSEHGFIVASAPRTGCTAPRSGSTSRASGATENLLMAAVLAEGTTVIDNAAREPEIVDICRMLQAMGAQIDGVGTSTLEIEGVDGCSPVDAHDRAGPHGRGHLGRRRRDDPRRRDRPRRPGRAPRDRRWTSWAAPARTSSGSPTASGCAATTARAPSTS